MYYAAQCVEPGRAILDPTPIPYLPTTQKTLQKNSNLRLLLRRNAYFSSPNIFSSGRANWERKTRSTRTVGSVCPCHVERHWKKITHHCSMRINFLLKKNKIYVVLGLQLSCHFNVENSPQAPNVNHEKKPKLVPHWGKTKQKTLQCCICWTSLFRLPLWNCLHFLLLSIILQLLRPCLFVCLSVCYIRTYVRPSRTRRKEKNATISP